MLRVTSVPRCSALEGEENGHNKSTDEMIQIFKDFMTRIVEFEELASGGSKMVVCFQQSLGFLRRRQIDKTSELVKRIMKDHGSNRLLSYIEAGCANSQDRVENMSKLDKCYCGLQDLIRRAEDIVSELEHLLKDAAYCVQAANDSVQDDYDCSDSFDNMNAGVHEAVSSDVSEPDITDYAALMAAIYTMVKKDFDMQERIVTSLSFKSSLGELETYCQMWSLRPYVDDDIMHQAWHLVPKT